MSILARVYFSCASIVLMIERTFLCWLKQQRVAKIIKVAPAQCAAQRKVLLKWRTSPVATGTRQPGVLTQLSCSHEAARPAVSWTLDHRVVLQRWPVAAHLVFEGVSFKHPRCKDAYVWQEVRKRSTQSNICQCEDRQDTSAARVRRYGKEQLSV